MTPLPMDRPRLLGCLSPLLLAGFLTVGCAGLPIPKGQYLKTPLPQSTELAAAPDQVWAVATRLAGSTANCGVLAQVESDGLFSWCESAGNWRDLGQDLVTVAYSPTGGTQPDMYEEIAHKPGTGVALTTLWVEEVGTCVTKLNLRRTYVGRNSVPAMAHSRGAFEREFYNNVRQELESMVQPSSDSTGYGGLRSAIEDRGCPR